MYLFLLSVFFLLLLVSREMIASESPCAKSFGGCISFLGYDMVVWCFYSNYPVLDIPANASFINSVFVLLIASGLAVALYFFFQGLGKYIKDQY